MPSLLDDLPYVRIYVIPICGLGKIAMLKYNEKCIGQLTI